MNEVAALSEMTESLLRERMTHLCFIRSIVFHVHPKLLRSVRELTFLAIGTVSFFCEIFAERSFGFGARSSGWCFKDGLFMNVMGIVVFLSFG